MLVQKKNDYECRGYERFELASCRVSQLLEIQFWIPLLNYFPLPKQVYASSKPTVESLRLICELHSV